MSIYLIWYDRRQKAEYQQWKKDPKRKLVGHESPTVHIGTVEGDSPEKVMEKFGLKKERIGDRFSIGTTPKGIHLFLEEITKFSAKEDLHSFLAKYW